MKFLALLIQVVFTMQFALQSSLADQLPAPEVSTTFQNCESKLHRSTWCESGGKRLSKYHQHNFIKQLLGESLNEEANIFISTFSYNTPYFKDLFCNVNSPAQNITLAIDVSYKDDKELLKFKRKCDSSKNSNLRIISPIKSLDSQDYRIFHSKLFIIDSPTKDTLKIIYGTANISRATFAIHFDLWNTVEVPRESQFAKQHLCYQEAVRVASSALGDGIEDFQKAITTCRARKNLLTFDQALLEEGITSLFLPGENGRLSQYVMTKINKLKKGETLRLASQIFTYSDLARAIKNAAQRGVRVELLLEDDAVSGTGQSKRTHAFLRKNFNKSGIHLKFIETNHEIPQYFHMRYLIIGDELLISGSGQLSYSGMNKNYENFYISTNSKNILSYRQLHEKLWNAGYTKQLSSHSVKQTPKKEESFLDKLESFLGILY